MIDSYEEAIAILSEDPDIDPEIFWPSVGFSYSVIRQVAEVGARAMNADIRAVIAAMESGATLAREGLKR